MAKVKTLRRCPLFQALSYRDLAILVPFIKEESADTNVFLAEEGKPTRGLVVVKKGKLKIAAKTSPGNEMEIGPGEFFGELSLADGDQTRAVSAQVLEPCEYLRLDPRDYHTLCAQAPEVAGKLARGVLDLMSRKVIAVRAILGEMLTRG